MKKGKIIFKSLTNSVYTNQAGGQEDLARKTEMGLPR